jgi:hypothetical protein
MEIGYKDGRIKKLITTRWKRESGKALINLIQPFENVLQSQKISYSNL